MGTAKILVGTGGVSVYNQFVRKVRKIKFFFGRVISTREAWVLINCDFGQCIVISNVTTKATLVSNYWQNKPRANMLANI